MNMSKRGLEGLYEAMGRTLFYSTDKDVIALALKTAKDFNVKFSKIETPSGYETGQEFYVMEKDIKEPAMKFLYQKLMEKKYTDFGLKEFRQGDSLPTPKNIKYGI